ncbi:MAG: ATP-binding protein [Bacteroidetes bacterium]|nr:ATP-binding protein [Bacteroidota bacterium]
MIPRVLQPKLEEWIKYFPVLFLTGPRQSGKTTLVKNTFPDLPYSSLENPDNREFAENDPRGYLQNFKNGAVLDEVQRVPLLFNYLQGIVDQDPNKRFILSGSQNFLLHQGITQSLAGRAGVLSLLPFCVSEIITARGENAIKPWEELLFNGFYPGIYDRNIPPAVFYPSYISTYVERDVRLIKNIGDLNTFIRFLKLCAGRTGQLLNLSSLASDAGIATNTAKDWLSVLESSYIIFFLRPYHKNFNKRLVKMPKIYFYDTGLLCSLLELHSPEQVSKHFAMGSLFENLVILETLKHNLNRALKNTLYFWRDSKGREIDLIIPKEEKDQFAIEIKAGRTKQMDYFSNLKYWNGLSQTSPDSSIVIYGGDEHWQTQKGTLIPWKEYHQWLIPIEG